MYNNVHSRLIHNKIIELYKYTSTELLINCGVLYKRILHSNLSKCITFAYNNIDESYNSKCLMKKPNTESAYSTIPL